MNTTYLNSLLANPTLQLDDILLDPPLIHAGGTLVWGLGEDVLRYLDKTLKPGAKTLETGAGISTILFALRSAEHTCIVPSEEEIGLIREYCQRKNISLDHVHFIAEYSQDVVPTLERKDLDFVLIDGGHGYPIPAIDWFYTTPMLKVGGVVIVDDVQIWTGFELKRFLSSETTWQPVQNFDRSAAYEKTSHDYAREWHCQPYVVQKSRSLIALNSFQSMAKLLLSGNFSEVATKVRRRFAT